MGERRYGAYWFYRRMYMTKNEFDQLYQEGSYEALAPYKVDNAVIMAAGLSSRFAPLSDTTPKPLLRVKGEIMIERQIRQLQEAGISEIYLVVGYKKEMFSYLSDKYGVHLLENPDFAVRNNNSSIYSARHILGNSYICSSDNYFMENVFEPYVYRSYYAASYAKGTTGEYCLTTDINGLITDVSVGGSDSWYMMGHVYWNREFSSRFVEFLEAEYDLPETKQMYWENIYMKHIRQLPLYIRRYPEGIVREFDSLKELCQFDPSYIPYLEKLIHEEE